MITREEIKSIADNGIWKQNTSIVQILALCPLLAVTTNAVNGIMLSLATIIVMALSNVAVASLPGFTLPGDISASAKYFAEDIVESPFVLNGDSTLTVPTAPGLGIVVDARRLEQFTVATETFTAHAAAA